MMLRMNFLEAKISEHCNYQCIACFSYSNIAKKEFYPIAQFSKDIQRVGVLFDDIAHFSLLGGEPLLNPEVCNYIIIARQHLPSAEINLVTNGVLLSTMDESFFHCVVEHKVKIKVSQYPEKRDEARLKEAKKRLKKHKIEYYMYPMPFFHISKHLEQNTYDTQLAFDICRNSMECTTVCNGRIYHCARTCSLKHYDEHFGTSYANIDDGFPLHDPHTDRNTILSFLSSPAPACQYCTPNRKYIKWRQGQAKQEDWQVIPDNKNILPSNQDIRFNHELLEGIIAVYFEMSDSRGKGKMISLSNLLKLKNRDVYVWVGDLTSIWLFEALHLYALHIGVNIMGIVTSDSRIERALNYMDKIEFKEIPLHSCVFVLAFDDNSKDKALFAVKRKIIKRGLLL
jgi:organic radical activating enzyme